MGRQLGSEDFWQLLLAASRADTAIERAIASGEPSHVARYAFQLAQAFNTFYHDYHVLAEENREKRTFLLWMTHTSAISSCARSTFSASPSRRTCSARRSIVAVGVGHAEPVDGVAFEVELDQHRRFVALYPPVMPRLDHHDLWSLEFQRAAIGILNVNLPPSQKSYVRMQAQFSSGDRPHVRRPAEAGRIDHALHAAAAGPDNVELQTADLPVVRPTGSVRAVDPSSLMRSYLPFQALTS